MRHVEENECSVLRAEEFERTRAEKMIMKEVLIADREPVLGSRYSSNASEAPGQGGMSLVDTPNPDWNDHDASTILQPTGSVSSQATAPLTAGLERLKLSNFPPLSAQQTEPPNTSTAPQPKSSGEDLLDLDEPEERTTYKSQWHSIHEETTKDPPGTAWGDRNSAAYKSTNTAATKGIMQENTRPGMWARSADVESDLPPVNNSTASNPHVRSMTSTTAPSILDPENYWNDHEQCYTCPSPNCRRNLATVEDFKAHVLMATHMGGRTQCPACLKKFNSTAALVSHCEQGSRKCQIRKSPNYDEVLRELTSGLLTTSGYLEDGSVQYKAVEVDDW